MNSTQLSELLLLHGNAISRVQQQLTKNLIEQNNANRERTLCKICFFRTIETIFLPCCHYISCGICAEKLFECALCRSNIEDRKPVYM
jgi:hypothetical protein